MDDENIKKIREELKRIGNSDNDVVEGTRTLIMPLFVMLKDLYRRNRNCTATYFANICFVLISGITDDVDETMDFKKKVDKIFMKHIEDVDKLLNK